MAEKVRSVAEPSGLTYANRLARAFFIAMEDVMGRHGLSTLLADAGLSQYIGQPPADNLLRGFDFVEMAALNQALEDMYGARGGRGMALRVGRAAYAMGLRNLGILRSLSSPVFQSQPINVRVDYGLQALVQLFNHFSDQDCRVNNSGDAYQFTIRNSPMAWGRRAEKPVCHAQVGILQETLRHASNGFEFHVIETTCRATGHDHCTFRINKKAIGEW